MKEDPENGKKSSHSAHASGMNEWILLVLEWEATDGAARSAVLHTALKSALYIMHILVMLIFFCHATIFW